MRIPITYAITVCNEFEEIIRLVDFLLNTMNEGDNILIQYDSESVTKEVLEYLNTIGSIHRIITVVGFPLNSNFADFKNNLKIHSTGTYIFNIDADELPSEFLVQNLNKILEANLETDVFFVPRINIVKGITDEHIQKWKWIINEKGWINFPDPQTRIYRRSSEILWKGPVHEQIMGYNTISVLPLEEKYCLYHEKEITRQEAQNHFYETNKWKK